MQNDLTPEGVEQPTSDLRSASPASFVPWDTLGRKGRLFTAGGPSVQEIAAFTRDEASEPIRVFAGTQSADDSAIVAIQYSYLPSWLSYLVDQERPMRRAVSSSTRSTSGGSELPAGNRPQLLAFGESLGSFGGETAFSGEYDMANRTDGMLLVGPPSFNTHNREFADDRHAESPEVDLVYRDRRTARLQTWVTTSR